MDVNAINTISASQTETVKRQTPVTETKNEEAKQTTDTKKVTESKKQEDSGVIYEKTSSDGYYSIKNAGLIEQLKADNNRRKSGNQKDIERLKAREKELDDYLKSLGIRESVRAAMINKVKLTEGLKLNEYFCDIESNGLINYFKIYNTPKEMQQKIE